LSAYAPEVFRHYYEPFLGSGALFFRLMPPRAVLNDLNEELVNAYINVRDNVGELIGRLSAHRNEAEYYYRIRALDPATMSAVDRASRLIFLNRTCYNGLYRVNRQNQFNTPFGRYANPTICDEDGLRCASAALSDVELLAGDYRVALASAGADDFVYLDPPYIPVSQYSDFKRYTKEQFYEADHVELSRVFRDLDRRGARVMLSNSYHPLVLDLYDGYRIDEVAARRLINKDASKRHPVPELIVRNY